MSGLCATGMSGLCATSCPVRHMCPMHAVACSRCHSMPSCPPCRRSCRADGGCRREYSERDMRHVRCYTCGRRGHLSCAAAPEEPAALSCHNCGQGGHTAAECSWELPQVIRGEMAGSTHRGSFDRGGGGGGYSSGGYGSGGGYRQARLVGGRGMCLYAVPASGLCLRIKQGICLLHTCCTICMPCLLYTTASACCTCCTICMPCLLYTTASACCTCCPSACPACCATRLIPPLLLPAVPLQAAVGRVRLAPAPLRRLLSLWRYRAAAPAAQLRRCL